MGGIVMATTINAAASAGLVTTADTSTILQLQTNGITGIQVDASQKVTFANSLTSPTLVTPVINGMASSILTSGTAVASTSGTSIDFTGIPSWVKRITVMFYNVSLSGTSNILVQIGNGTAETTGYASASSLIGTGVSTPNATTGFLINTGAIALSYMAGISTIALVSSNVYVHSGEYYGNGGTWTMTSAGQKATSNVIDRVRITTVNGTDTFDAGSINILYE